MRKLLLALALSLASSGAWAQCTGVFPANTLCGNLGASAAPPAAFPSAGTIAGPASSTSGHFATWSNNLGTQVGDIPTITTSQVVFFQGITGFQSAATFSSTTSFNDVTNFTSQFQINGQRIQFPAVADTVGGLATSQSWSATNTFAGVLRAIGDTTLSHVISAFFNPAISVGSGGTGNATLSSHVVLLGNGTGPVSGTTTGNTGQCLASQGAVVDPIYGSGCWVLLNTLLPTNATSISDLTTLTGTYSKYKIELVGVIPTAVAAQLGMQFQLLNSIATSNYGGFYNGLSSAGGGTVRQSFPTSYVALTGAAGAGPTVAQPGLNGQVVIYTPSSSIPVMVTGQTTYQDGAATSLQGTAGYLTGLVSSFAAVTGVKFVFTSGNISTGVIRIYGGL